MNISKLNQIISLAQEMINEQEPAEPTEPIVNWSIPLQPLANEAGYHSQPYLVECDNGDILCVYRVGSSHISAADKVYLKRSTDRGLTWSSPQLFHTISGKITRNQTMGKTPSGRLIVFNRSGTVSVPKDKIWKHISDDNGLTWTTTEFTDSNGWLSFGSMIQTCNGLMQTFYTTNNVFALFSTDNGDTWGNKVTIFNEAWTSAQLSEPQAIAIDENRIVCIMRDNLQQGRFWHIKSVDGGLTWIERGYGTYSSTAGTASSPVSMCLRGDIVHFVFTSRHYQFMSKSHHDKEDFFANPRIAYQQTDGAFYTCKQGTATGGEFGYPNLLNLPEGILLAWYDSKTGNGTTETEILIQSI